MTGEYLFLFSIVFVVSFLINRKWKGRKGGKPRSPPSLPSLPLVGSLPFLRNFNNIAEFFMEKSLQLGPIFTFRIGRKLVLTLNNSEIIEEALVKNSGAFSSRPEIFMEKIANRNDKGLVFVDTSPEWKQIHRSTLSILREFGFGDKNIMEERTLREFEAVVEQVRKQRGRAFDPKELFLCMTSNIITNIMFGTRDDYDLGVPEMVVEIDRLTYLLDMAYDIAPFLKYIPPFKGKIPRIIECWRNMHNIIDKEIDASQQRQETCYVSEYISREGPLYDREQLNFAIRDLRAAGTDTTAATLLWSVIVMANCPEIQQRLQSEIDSVIPRERFPILQDRSRLPYVEATILEVYRWRTLLPLSIAHYTSRDVVLRGYHIPAGTLVMPNLLAAHSDPNVWIEPNVFRPERFLDKENNVVGRERVIPFSLGRRSCLGEILARTEIFLIFTSLLQKFTILPPEGQDKVCDKPRLPITLVASPPHFSVRMMERQ